MGGRETQNPECSWDEVYAVSMIKWLWMMEIVSVYYVFHHKALWKTFLERNRWTRYSYQEHFRFRSSPLIWTLQIFFFTLKEIPLTSYKMCSAACARCFLVCPFFCSENKCLLIPYLRKMLKYKCITSSAQVSRKEGGKKTEKKPPQGAEWPVLICLC